MAANIDAAAPERHRPRLAGGPRAVKNAVMEWTDHGTVLTLRPHGETSAIVEVFTESRGRHAGVVRGGISRRIAPYLQPGNEIAVTWRARLEDHLGAFTAEPLQSRSAAAFADRGALAALNAVTALLAFLLPEREPHPRLYARSSELLDRLGRDGWPLDYLRWELALLDEMGFGLDLSACAVTGSRDGLAFVSPRTGRAVSAAAAGDWTDRLLPLPPPLLGRAGSHADLLDGLRTTSHFLSRHLAHSLGDRPLPEARARLIDTLTRRPG